MSVTVYKIFGVVTYGSHRIYSRYDLILWILQDWVHWILEWKCFTVISGSKNAFFTLQHVRLYSKLVEKEFIPVLK